MEESYSSEQVSVNLTDIHWYMNTVDIAESQMAVPDKTQIFLIGAVGDKVRKEIDVVCFF